MFKNLFSRVLICLFSLLFFLPPELPLAHCSLNCKTVANPIYKKIIELLMPQKEKQIEVQSTGKFVYVSGYPIGFSIDGQGAVVVEKSAVITSEGYKLISENSEIEIGDIIKKINDENITSGETIQEIINRKENINKPVRLLISHNGEEKEVQMQAEYDIFAQSYRLGLWVRDNAVGVGMMTIIEEDGRFASLGHPITDIDTGSVIPVRDGRVYKCSIIGIKKGEKGVPGELKGLFLKTSSTIGKVEENTNYGVFGRLDEKDISSYSYQKLEVAKDEEVVMGEASVITTVDGVTPKEYKVEVVKTNYKSSSGDKCMVIRIVDEELISLTGGIVQGMSGSPIVQNGKVIGCITHVFVNDPKKGFANYVSTLVE